LRHKVFAVETVERPLPGLPMRRTSRPVWRLLEWGLTRNAAGMALGHHIARTAIF
jgi:hypothetical protein